VTWHQLMLWLDNTTVPVWAIVGALGVALVSLELLHGRR
jgi:hypothetical protein